MRALACTHNTTPHLSPGLVDWLTSQLPPGSLDDKHDRVAAALWALYHCPPSPSRDGGGGGGEGALGLMGVKDVLKAFRAVK